MSPSSLRVAGGEPLFIEFTTPDFETVIVSLENIVSIRSVDNRCAIEMKRGSMLVVRDTPYEVMTKLNVYGRLIGGRG
jgi:hypothetical protein